MKEKQYSLYNLSKYRNVIMGLQIVLILVFHFTEDCKINNVRYSGWIYFFYNYIRSSGVDGFLFLSGLGLYFSMRRRQDKHAFYRKRMERLIIPYVIVAIPAWIFIDMIYKGNGIGKFFSDFFFLTFFGEGEKLFWYVIMIAFCYAIFPYLFEVIDTANNRIEEHMRVVLLCILTTVISILFKLYHNELYNNISIALLRFPPFFIGIYVGKSTYEKRIISITTPLCSLLIAILFLGPLEMFDKDIIAMYVRAFLNIAICLSFTLLLEFMVNSQNHFFVYINKIFVSTLGWFGKYTFELYLIHILVRRIMNTLGFKTYRLSYEALMLVISLILAVVLGHVVSNIQFIVDKGKDRIIDG